MRVDRGAFTLEQSGPIYTASIPSRTARDGSVLSRSLHPTVWYARCDFNTSTRYLRKFGTASILCPTVGKFGTPTKYIPGTGCSLLLFTHILITTIQCSPWSQDRLQPITLEWKVPREKIKTRKYCCSTYNMIITETHPHLSDKNKIKSDVHARTYQDTCGTLYKSQTTLECAPRLTENWVPGGGYPEPSEPDPPRSNSRNRGYLYPRYPGTRQLCYTEATRLGYTLIYTPAAVPLDSRLSPLQTTDRE